MGTWTWFSLLFLDVYLFLNSPPPLKREKKNYLTTIYLLTLYIGLMIFTPPAVLAVEPTVYLPPPPASIHAPYLPLRLPGIGQL